VPASAPTTPVDPPVGVPAHRTADRIADRITGRPSLRRSVTLFRGFLVEQTDPDHFYSLLARDTVDQIRRYAAVRDRLVLDIGGGPGYFAEAFTAAGARYVGLDVDHAELLARRAAVPLAVVGDARRLPLGSGSVDLAVSSNVLEHLDRPWAMADEMVRVTRPGGLIYLSFTPWLSPWGGHETSPWHYLGGARARRRYARRYGREPKNRWGETLYGYSVRAALRWARRHPGVAVVEALPRYHPWWAKGVVAVPGVREIAAWNLVLVLRRRAGGTDRP
jgi:arabinofuranan 3-O-arabinosyltransferase